jgi:hypothetical protein
MNRRHLLKSLLGIPLAVAVPTAAEAAPAPATEGILFESNNAPVFYGTNFYVDPIHGDDANPGTTTTSAFKTIGRALAAMRSDDTVHVGACQA